MEKSVLRGIFIRREITDRIGSWSSMLILGRGWALNECRYRST